MKILFFSPYFLPYTSGITTGSYTFLNHLSKTHEVTVLTFPHDTNLAACERIGSITVKRLPYLFKVSKGYISPQSLWYFFKEAQNHDRIILNVPNVEGVGLALIGKLLGKPLISLLNCIVILPNGFFNKIIESILNTCIYIQLILSQEILTYTQDYLEHSWVNSIFKKNPAKFHFLLPPIKILPVSKPFLAQLQEQKGQEIWIGFAGRVAREKGIEYLIEAVAALQIELPQFRFKLIIAGPDGKSVAGETEYYEYILTLLQEKALPYSFLGKLSDEHFGAFFKAIDVLVLPSTNSTEAFGIVQAEAMVLGTPVICTNLPGVRVPIQLTQMGEIVTPGNATQLQSKLKKITSNRLPYTNEQLVRNAQHIFSSETMLNTFAAISTQ